MNTQDVSIPVMGKLSVQKCPCCKEFPNLEADVSCKNKTFLQTEYDIHYYANCELCGTSAPLDIWNRLEMGEGKKT